MALRPTPLLAMILALAPFPALAAGLNLQVYGGSRTTSFEPEPTKASGEPERAGAIDTSELAVSDTFTGVEAGISALIQPLPAIPLAFGVFAIQQRLNGRADDVKDRITGILGGAEGMAWLYLGNVQPFVRAGWDLFSSHKYTSELEADKSFAARAGKGPTTLEMEGTMRGWHGAAGLRFKSTPALGAFIQADFAKETFKAERASVTQDGYGYTARADDVPEVKLESTSFMLGIDVGT